MTGSRDDRQRRAEPEHIPWLVRRLFRLMAQTGDRYLAKLGIGSAERAVLEFLHRDGSLTVPHMARRRNVSRQHIQATVNQLLEKGLVTTAPNPDHKRSPLIRLTRRGTACFARAEKLDAGMTARLFQGVARTDLRITAATLERLRDRLREIEQGGE